MPARKPSPHDRNRVPSEAELERMLAEAEGAVTRLRSQLADLRGYRADAFEAAEQHAEIDRLHEHLSQAQVHWKQVWDFFEEALQELRAQQTGDRVDGHPSPEE